MRAIWSSIFFFLKKTIWILCYSVGQIDRVTLTAHQKNRGIGVQSFVFWSIKRVLEQLLDDIKDVYCKLYPRGLKIRSLQYHEISTCRPRSGHVVPLNNDEMIPSLPFIASASLRHKHHFVPWDRTQRGSSFIIHSFPGFPFFRSLSICYIIVTFHFYLDTTSFSEGNNVILTSCMKSTTVLKLNWQNIREADHRHLVDVVPSLRAADHSYFTSPLSLLRGQGE